MPKRKNPETSIDAYKSLQPDQLKEIYQKIIEALKVLGTASTEQIADYTTLPHPKIHKRVSEMEKLEIIYRPGNRVATKSGRTAYVWCLCNQPITDNQQKVTEKALRGPTVADFSRDISSISNKVSQTHQQELF